MALQKEGTFVTYIGFSDKLKTEAPKRSSLKLKSFSKTRAAEIAECHGEIFFNIQLLLSVFSP
jgi:hypothetical protein